MKKLILIVVLCSIPSLAYAGMEVNVLSANFAATIWAYSQPDQTYSKSKGVPFNYSMLIPFPNGSGEWPFSDGGSASLGYFSSSVQSGENGNVQATEDITFQPVFSGSMSFTYAGGGWEYAQASISDLTSGTTIWSLSLENGYHSGANGEISYGAYLTSTDSALPSLPPYIFSSADTYLFALTTYGNGGGDGPWGTSFSTDATVPESDTAFLLGFGLLGLAAFRRKRERSVMG